MVDKAGAWYSHQGDKIGQGKQNAIQYLREHAELATSLETQIKQQLLSTPEDTKVEADVDELTEENA